ncbi:MAG: Cof-type HAD-IIB family hydrolase [Cyanobacteria bacterium]|nr:Cof-type HAD-IIB family hydrolase [Cyanobacteriota bacterium]MDW8200233.1 HAD family hydrolase [Cyanobacteriota bacterium SKYGB_h_bin112]
MVASLQQLADSNLQLVQLVATDVDGTLTSHQRFTPQLLTALQALATAGITVVLTTGRSAGWASALVHYLPVMGAIAENGGLYLTGDGDTLLLSAISDIDVHRQQLAQFFQELATTFPKLQSSSDNAFRLTDWSFDVAGLTESELSAIASCCQQRGWGFTYSNIQGHIKPLGQDKAIGLQQLLARQFPQLTPQQVLTIGDSPNDEPMFNPEMFPLSIGVANVLPYCGSEHSQIMCHLPRYVTNYPEVAGFCEIVQHLLLTHSETHRG